MNIRTIYFAKPLSEGGVSVIFSEKFYNNWIKTAKVITWTKKKGQTERKNQRIFLCPLSFLSGSG